MALVNYYFGRLNFIAYIPNKHQFIVRGLKTPKFIQHRGFSWGFFDIKELETEIGSIMHGFLVKYEPFNEETIVAEPQTHQLKNEPIENKVIARSRFFIHEDSNLIAYHPVNGISKRHFSRNFAEIFKEEYGTLVDVEIQSIDEQFKFLDEIKKFKSIKKVEIYLHPSNPVHRDIWKDVDERLKKLEAGSSFEQIKSKGEGFSEGLKNIEEDKDISSKIAMSEDGYGETKVTGIYDDYLKTISTKDNPLQAKAPSDIPDPKFVIDILLSTFRKILDRFTK